MISRCENQSANEIIQSGIGKDLTSELSAHAHRASLEYITTHLKVGKYGPSNCEEKVRQTYFTINYANIEFALSLAINKAKH